MIRATKLTRPVLVGHSWGANVALELAARRPRLVGGAVLVDGGFLSMRDRFDWKTARASLAPPELNGMPLEEFRRSMRLFSGGAIEITAEIETVFLSLVRVGDDGRIRPRLSRANHLRILRAAWEQDVRALLRKLRVPTLVLGVRSASASSDTGFLREKERAARFVRSIGDPVRFAWVEGIHDIPLQRPGMLARRIERFTRQAVG